MLSKCSGKQLEHVKSEIKEINNENVELNKTVIFLVKI